MAWIPLEAGLQRPSLDPIIKALFDRLPQAGSVWPVEDQRMWLSAVEAAFNVVYAEAPCCTNPPEKKP